MFFGKCVGIRIRGDEILIRGKAPPEALMLERWFDVESPCHICHKHFHSTNDRVRDREHVTEMYRGAAHRWFKIRRRGKCKIPLFILYFRRYESHLISLTLNDFPGHDIRVIGQGMQ